MQALAVSPQKRCDDPAQQVTADTRAAHGHQADLLVVAIAELTPQPHPVRKIGGVEAGHIAREGVVLTRPVSDEWKVRPERVRDDVGVVSDEDGLIPDPGKASDVFDHLRVVVGCQKCFVLASIGHRKPADEVSQPDVRRLFLLRVLVEVVVEFPSLVADPQVVRVVAHHIMEHHEVGEQDLIHPSDRLEAVQIMLCGFAFDVAGFVRQESAGWMDMFASRLQDRGNRVLGEPIDLKIRMELAQLVGDRHVTLGVAQSDRGRDVDCPLSLGLAAHPAPRRRHRLDEVAQQQVDLHRIANMRCVAGAFQQD